MKSSMISKDEICVVIVTYARRYLYVERLLERIRELGLSNVVIFDNNSASDVMPIQVSDLNIWQISDGKNLGTAKAFGKALSFAKKREFKFAFMLDDDNLPEAASLDMLLSSAQDLSEKFGCCFGLSCERDGYQSSSFWLPRNNVSKYVSASFLGSTNKKLASDVAPMISVQNAPYGGLFFPLELISHIGLPREDFVLYVDDLEFTSRIFDSYNSLFLCVGALVEDQEVQGARVTRPSSSNSAAYFRTYYSIRNQVFFDKQRKKSGVIFAINRVIFFLRVIAVFAFKNRSPSYLMFAIRGIYDGEFGRLGARLELH